MLAPSISLVWIILVPSRCVQLEIPWHQLQWHLWECLSNTPSQMRLCILSFSHRVVMVALCCIASPFEVFALVFPSMESHQLSVSFLVLMYSWLWGFVVVTPPALPSKGEARRAEEVTNRSSLIGWKWGSIQLHKCFQLNVNVESRREREE